MQILEENQNNFELKIDSLDDLWVLSEFISPGDKVFASTSRKVKIGNDKTKQITKIIFVKLLVKKIEFNINILRISGEIQNETEFTAVGQSQTLNFTVNDKIKIKKNSLLEFEKKLLDRAVKSKNSKILLVILDKDELIVSDFNDFSFKVYFHRSGLSNKKYYSTKINELEIKFNLIKEYLNQDYSSIIFAGPGIYKNNLQNYVKSKINKKILIFQFPEVNSNQIQKLIKNISHSGILENNQISEESEVIDLLLKNISLNQKYAYGEKMTFNAINIGAIENLLISTKYIEKQKENGNYLELNNKMRQVEQLNGKITIINSKHNPGNILDGLGSIGAILRY